MIFTWTCLSDKEQSTKVAILSYDKDWPTWSAFLFIIWSWVSVQASGTSRFAKLDGLIWTLTTDYLAWLYLQTATSLTCDIKLHLIPFSFKMSETKPKNCLLLNFKFITRLTFLAFHLLNKVNKYKSFILDALHCTHPHMWACSNYFSKFSFITYANVILIVSFLSLFILYDDLMMTKLATQMTPFLTRTLIPTYTSLA